MSEPAFSEKFIGFVDILGFKNMVAAAEDGRGMPLQTILNAAKKLGTSGERERYRQDGPRVCPCAPKLSKGLDFEITQVSDCVIVSAEISPAGLIKSRKPLLGRLPLPFGRRHHVQRVY
jgi:hypothetical protein